jgi:hypothetical protein
MCNEKCWTRADCPVCGRELPPRGRSVPLEMSLATSQCCENAVSDDGYARHLWDIHDSDRAYVDPEGWKIHVAGCKNCKNESDERNES